MRASLLVAGIFALLCGAQIAVAQETSPPVEAPEPYPRPHIAYLDKSKTIYVTEFETSSENAHGAPPKYGPVDTGSMGNPRSSGTRVEQVGASGRLTTLLAESLVREIKKAGYKPKMLVAGDSRPDDGILISGVYTETGKDGQLRRAVPGTARPAGDLQLYVTTSNLLRPAKPLYEVVKPASDHGLESAIKLNPDVATVKFSVNNNPGDKDLKKTAAQIVAELQRLTLQAESEGSAGSDDPLNKYSKP